MKQVYADAQLQLTKGDFERPEGLKEDYFNCATFDANQPGQNSANENEKY